MLLISAVAFGQGSYTAQIRGTVADQTGAIVPNARVTVTNDGTAIASSTTTDSNGQYVFNGLRPATYTVKVETTGFQETVQKNVVLAVAQQATLDFALKPATSVETMTVTDTAPLLDTGGSSLGTEVTNEFIGQMPLANRDVTQLVYLSAGVAPLNNAGGYPYGTDFSSNGQRYGSAEIRLDGTLATGPEQGEGATTNLSYVPSAEVIQEFKVQNNSFSAEFGSNGGTVVNVLLKSGTNSFHGSGWWFGRRTALNANDFYSNRYGVSRGDSTRDQYGFSILGPVVKGKTFFLFDLERVRQNDKSLISGRVPTDLERMGDFRQTLVGGAPVQIFNPRAPLVGGARQPFAVNNLIDANLIDPVGQALVNAYPEPTGPIDPGTESNFNKGVVVRSPGTQFDAKIDHELTTRMRLMGRYSQSNADFIQPGLFFDGINGHTTTRNIALEHTWTITPELLLTSRFGLDRYYQKGVSEHVDPTKFGLPDLLVRANNITRMPVVAVDNYQGLNFTGPDAQCCVDTVNGHTQYVYSSALNWVKGKHVVKFGGEQRIFFNNFLQPDYATGLFNFSKGITAQHLDGSDPTEYGTGLAGLLLGFPSDGLLNIKPSVADKSSVTALYLQDDWKVTPRLSLSLGLRYEWSVPYADRHNRIQFSDFSGNSGITADLTPPTTDINGDPIVDDNSNPVDLSGLGLGVTQLQGITRFATASTRHIPVDRNNFGPRVGFAYQIAQNTVVRGGIGVFYGLSSATNFQYPGTAFQKSAPIHFTNDNGETQYATLTNLFPSLPAGQLPQAQVKTYGTLAEWGFNNNNDLGTGVDRNPETYQWNFGLQHLFPLGIVISTDYSANRSTHLPWGGPTRERDFLSTKARLACDTTCQNTLVANPLQSLFVGPTAIFNEPESRYNSDSIPLVNLLLPYPQFDGSFQGQPLLQASSWYHGLLVRFQKRPSHGLSFEGNYTLSKATDNSSYGANYWIFFNGSGLGSPQDLNDLKAEHSVGANDTRHRFELATVYELPFGRGRSFGGNMNRVLDGAVGGWSLNALLQFQTGQPIPFAVATSRLANGLQRPNISCNPMSGISLHALAFSTDPNANFFSDANNGDCFSDPGDQIAGNAPRFSSNARGPGIKNLDLGLFKSFVIREGKRVEVRAEFLNATNTVRFATPFSGYNDSGFGLVTTQANSPRRIQMGVRFEF